MRILKRELFSADISSALVDIYDSHGGMVGSAACSLIGYAFMCDPMEMPVVNIKVSDKGMLRGERPETYYGDGKSHKYVEFKLVKLLKKIGGDGYEDKVWEEIGNLLIPRLWPEWNFELLRGRDIRTAYHEKEYAYGSGTLSNSCMRYSSCQSYFQLYWKNPDVCSLLVSRDAHGKIQGRCLIWTTESGEVVADRIYGTNATIKAFEKYILEQGWWLRKSYKDDGTWTWKKPDGSVESRNFRVKLNKFSFQTYPYMDTFRMLDTEGGFISTKMHDGDYMLSSTGGGSEFLGRRVPCPSCGQQFRQRNGWLVGRATVATMCRDCGKRATRRCDHCSYWFMREDMVADENGHYYCREHVPPSCVVCRSSIRRVGNRHTIEGREGVYCMGCYNATMPTYTTADGYTIPQTDYDTRTTCHTCNRFWSQSWSNPPMDYNYITDRWECRDCRAERMNTRRADDRQAVVEQLSQMEQWRTRWNIGPEDMGEYRESCRCVECNEYRAARDADQLNALIDRLVPERPAWPWRDAMRS